MYRYRIGVVNAGGLFDGHNMTGLNRLRHTISVQPGGSPTTGDGSPTVTLSCAAADVAALGLPQAQMPASQGVDAGWLIDGGLEALDASTGLHTEWTAYDTGFTAESTEVRSGNTSIRVDVGTGGARQVVSQCHCVATTPMRHSSHPALALQIVVFDPPIAPDNFTIAAWSKAVDAGGAGATGTNSGYCVYADVFYSEGDSQWGQTARFQLGTHDWELAETTFAPVDVSSTRKVRGACA